MIPSLDQLTVIANRPTFERRRAEAMGWTFYDIRVTRGNTSWHDQYALRGAFTCVCGAREQFQRIIDEAHLFMAHNSDSVIAEEFDPALWLRRMGSFSRKHLLADGYTEDAVAEIERKAIEFDAAHGITTGPRPVLRSVADAWKSHV